MTGTDWNAYGLAPVAWVGGGVLLYLVVFLLSRVTRATRRWPRLLRAAFILIALAVLGVLLVRATPALPAAGPSLAILRGLVDTWLVAPGRWAELGFMALWVSAGLVLGPWLIAMIFPAGAVARRVRPVVAYSGIAGVLALIILFEAPLRQLVDRIASDGAKVELPGGVRLEMHAVAERTAQAPFTLRAGDVDQAGAALATATYEMSRITMHSARAWPGDPFSHLSLIERDFQVIMTSPGAARGKDRYRQRAQTDLRFIIGITPVFSCLHQFSEEIGDRALLLPLLGPFLHTLVTLVDHPPAGAPAPARARAWVGRVPLPVADLAEVELPQAVAEDAARMDPPRRLAALQSSGRRLVSQLNLLLRDTPPAGASGDVAGQTGCSHLVSVGDLIKAPDLTSLGATPYPAIAAAQLFVAIGAPESGVALLDRWIRRQPPPLTPGQAWWPIRARIQRAEIADRMVGPQALTGEARSLMLRELSQELSVRFDRRTNADKDAADALCETILANPLLPSLRARQSVAFTHALFRSRAFSLMTPSSELSDLAKWIGQSRELVQNAGLGCFDGLRRFDEAREGWLALLDLDRLWLEAMEHFPVNPPTDNAAERRRRSAQLLAASRAVELRLASFIRSADRAGAPAAPTVNWCVHLDRANRLSGAIQLAVADRSALTEAAGNVEQVRSVRNRCASAQASAIAHVRAD